MKPAVVYPLTKPEFDDNYSTNYAELLFVRPLYCTCCSSGHCIAHVVRPAIVLLMLFVRPLHCSCCSSGHCIAHVVRPAIVLHMLFIRPLYCTCYSSGHCIAHVVRPAIVLHMSCDIIIGSVPELLFL